MPAPQQSFIVATPPSTITLALEPAHNAFHSLTLLTKADRYSGFGPWISETLQAMSPEEIRRHRLVIVGFYFAIEPTRSWPSFPAYLDYLASLPPQTLVDRLLDMYARMPLVEDGDCQEWADQPRPIDRGAILSSVESYLDFLYSLFTTEGVEEEVEIEAYRLIKNPPALQQLVVSHLRFMWQNYLKAEWQRVLPMLQNAVDAFSAEDLSDMTRLQAASYITGKELEEEKWGSVLRQAAEIVFVPSAHVGPYLGRFRHNGTLGIIFGARPPARALVQAPDLSRAQIVVRLNALADDTRLSILKLVAAAGELRSQEIMDELDLSQSAASRHLKQLSATGYLSERRCAGAKCYSLNEERIEDTLQAIRAFLLR